jgi:hypothetical protein
MNTIASTLIRSFKFVAVCGLIAAALLIIHNIYRDRTIDRLFREAAGYPSYFRNSDQSTEAVRRLSTFRNRRSTEALLQLALGQGEFVAPETRAEAFSALRGRNEPGVADTLATLLQPHSGLRSRQGAAKALQDIPCPDDCIRSILHYLERISNGEPNEEDRTIFPPGSESWKADQDKDEQTLYSDLQDILRRESVTTLSNLSNIYGLGSDNPSIFALNLVSHMQFQQSCPLLLQSKQALDRRRAVAYRGPSLEVQTVIATLHCR